MRIEEIYCTVHPPDIYQYCSTLLAVSLLPSPATIPAARVFFLAKAAVALGGCLACPSVSELCLSLVLPPRSAPASAVVLGEKGRRRWEGPGSG
jgi:hypothetical protein